MRDYLEEGLDYLYAQVPDYLEDRRDPRKADYLEEEDNSDYLEEQSQCEEEIPVDDDPDYLEYRRDPM
jgi:hypothetical protein